MTQRTGRDVPFYQQTFDFTCGPACLIMALHHFDPSIRLDRAMEIEIWREANMVEIRGTTSYGLALSAWRRGFPVRIINNTDAMPLRQLILKRRPEVKEELLDLFFEDLKKKCLEAGIPSEFREIELDDMKLALLKDELPILLTSTRVSAEEHIPHWILVTGWEGDRYFVNNPYVPDGRRVEVLSEEVLLRNMGFEGEQSLVLLSARTRGRGN